MKYAITNSETMRHVMYVISNLDAEKGWNVEIKRKTKQRTLSQNALYWRWMNEIAALVSEQTGYEKDEVHELFKDTFLDPKIITIGGVTTKRYSTQNLTTKEMSKYMDRVDRFCIQNLGISLPIPAELHLR